MPGARELHPALEPLSFLLGTWRGLGVGGYATLDEDFRYGQELTFRHWGTPVLHYMSRTWLLDEAGQLIRPAAAETGWWRPQPAGGVEVLLAHPSGVAEIYVGQVTGTRVEMATDVVARTTTAKEVNASQRLYGLVDGRLLYAVDMAMMGQPLSPHLSAQLERVAEPS